MIILSVFFFTAYEVKKNIINKIPTNDVKIKYEIKKFLYFLVFFYNNLMGTL